MERFEIIFGSFLERAYSNTLSNKEIMFEIRTLRKCNSLDDYLRISRKGTTLVLNRAKRISIWGLYQNAQNHACIEAEMQAAN